MKKLICFVLSLILIFIGYNGQVLAYPIVMVETTTSEDNISSETSDIQEEVYEISIESFIELTEEDILTSAEATDLIAEQEAYIQKMITILTKDKALGLNLNNPVIEIIVVEIRLAQIRIDNYTEIYEKRKAQEEEMATKEKARLEECQSKYDSANYIWQYFKNQNYSDQAIAGILGNIMAEVGGQTLYIQYWLENSSYYGMCQWAKIYYPNVIGMGLEEQCDYLLSTIESEFNTFGYLAESTYESFIQSTDEQSAALIFAKVYERCGSSSYSIRQKNATTAYNYFIK